jgi:hypothetical protein
MTVTGALAVRSAGRVTVAIGMLLACIVMTRRFPLSLPAATLILVRVRPTPAVPRAVPGRGAKRTFTTPAAIGIIALDFVLALVVSWLLFILVERPVMRRFAVARHWTAAVS